MQHVLMVPLGYHNKEQVIDYPQYDWSCQYRSIISYIDIVFLGYITRLSPYIPAGYHH